MSVTVSTGYEQHVEQMVVYPDWRSVVSKGDCWNQTSQFGEDGIVAAIFDTIGATNKWCFEVGAYDGNMHSNTKRWRQLGWWCLLIESDADLYHRCVASSDAPNVEVVHKHLTDGHDLGFEMWKLYQMAEWDLGVLDVDGDEYNIWRTLPGFKPRVMVVEHNPYEGPDTPPGGGEHKQAGLNPLIELGRSLGYKPAVHTHCNVVFVSNDAI